MGPAHLPGLSIGLTYDLRSEYLKRGYTSEQTAELDSEETIAALEAALKSLGHRVTRIGTAVELAKQLEQGLRWDLVFNVAEGIFGLGRESLVPALLDAYRIPYTFSDPAVLAVCLHKGLTKHVLRDLQLPTARFYVAVQNSDPLDHDAAGGALRFPLFVKPVAEGSSKGISSLCRVEESSELAPAVSALLERFQQPVLIEEYLPGREVTVGIVGTAEKARALGTLEITFEGRAEAHAYSYLNKQDYVGRISYAVVDDEFAREAEALAVRAWRGLGCRDAGRVDLRADADGRPSIMEINPLAGLQPGYSDLVILAERKGISHTELISEIIRSAQVRCTPR